VLDAGCGRGYLSKLIAGKKNISVTAIDVSLEESENKADNPFFYNGKS
jgi:2-polyprenyl-3-methyl-5-hydroxy-6-metoxy-1,4-benzoquinol methylase